jgi:hypothetical protein
MFEELMMWFYASMALMVGALLFMRWARPKPPPQFPPELVCDGCGQVCSDLLGGYCEYCVKKLAK